MQEILVRIQELLRVPLFTLAGTKVNGLTLLVSVLAVILAFWLSRILQKAVARFLSHRGIEDPGSIGVSQRLVHHVVLAFGFGFSLDLIGINLNALFAAGAIFAVAIGFGMQNLTQNFVSGVILLVERTIKPGDVLEVEGSVVQVRNLGVRATVVRTLDDEDLIVPNSFLVQSTVKNYTLRDRQYRLRTVVGVVYGSDMKLVREVLERTAWAFPGRMEDRDPVIHMREFGASSVDFDISVWIEDPFQMARARSRLNESIWWALKEAGVVIAFPQVDVHLDPPVMESLRELAAGPRGVVPSARTERKAGERDTAS